MSNYQQERNLRKLGLAPKMEFKKPPKPLKKVSDKKKAELEAIKVVGKPASKLELDKWFFDIQEKYWGNGIMWNSKYFFNYFLEF